MVRPRKELDVVQTFRALRILTLEQLCRKLRSSRSTVLRRLDEHGYYSSYNHSGKFLTIDELAEFDSRGLWAWNAARFSKHGNLKETVWNFVESSQQGMTHGELAALLGVRTHNSLLELVREEWILGSLGARDWSGLELIQSPQMKLRTIIFEACVHQTPAVRR